jgi:hypothetical protein
LGAGEAVKLQQLNKKDTGMALEKIASATKFLDTRFEFAKGNITILGLDNQVELTMPAIALLDFLLICEVIEFADKYHLRSPSSQISCPSTETANLSATARKKRWALTTAPVYPTRR